MSLFEDTDLEIKLVIRVFFDQLLIFVFTKQQQQQQGKDENIQYECIVGTKIDNSYLNYSII